jgi:hypothetical protein
MIPTTAIVTSAKTGAVPWKSPKSPPALWMKSIRSQSPTIWLGLQGPAGVQGS